MKKNKHRFQGICRLIIICFLIVSPFLLSCDGGGGGGGGGDTAETPPTEDTTLTVRAFMNSLDASATSDAVVKINGVEKGVTGSDGSFTTLVDPGTVEVRVYIAGLVGGYATVELDQGESESVDVIMGGNGLVEMTTLSIDQFEDGIQGNILDQDFGALTLRFVDDAGKTVVLVDVDEIAIWPLNGGSPVKLTSLFALQSDGTMEADDVEGIRNALKAVDGEVELRAMGDDPEGLVHDNSVKFHIGRFTLDVSVVAPPSNPALPVGIVPVKATLLGLGGTGTEIIFNATSDSSGNFTLTSIPIGSLDFEATVEDGGKVYNGFGILPMDGDKTILLALLTTEDILNGEQSITVTIPSVTGVSTSVPGASMVNPGATIVPQAGIEATVTATGGAKDVPGTDTATLSVPEGTQTVALEYMVSSAEYPTYVNQQSQYDDVWELKVMGQDGSFLFAISSRVNAMLNNPPIWQSDGTTGIITEELDVSDLTTVDTSITLFGSSTNVGDGALATTVTATLTFEPDFNISQAIPDAGTKFYSLPEFAEGNTFHRTFTLKLTGRPEGADIESVAVDLFQETDDTNLIPVMYPQGVDGVLVKEIDKNLLEVRVTTDDAFVLSPAPVHKIQFRFTVKIDAGGTMLEDTKDSGGEQLALWRMPAWIPRVGKRDVGGDNWASKGTIKWLEANASLVTAINDISGEHGRYIGHVTHTEGTDIDQYHFTHLLGTAPKIGGNNHAKLKAIVKEALSKCQTFPPCTPAEQAAAVADVKAWCVEARSKLTALANLDTVGYIYFTEGAADDELPNEWAETLLLTGKLKDNLDRSIDLGIGNWSEAKVTNPTKHNDHMHIGLNQPKLDENP